MNGHNQVNQEERYQIHILKKAEYNQTKITAILERDQSMISREPGPSEAGYT